MSLGTLSRLTILFLLLAMPMRGQNLLLDGGFEILKSNDCRSPTEGFKQLEHWQLLDATPDLFVGNCPFDEREFIYWDESLQPFEGSNYAGIWSRWNSDETFFSEGITTTLRAPLEAGKTYFFEMAIYNQGTYQGLGALVGCLLEPDKHIDLYLSHEPIEVVNDFSNGTASTSATLVASITSESVQADGAEDWTLVSTCFTATGGEQFFAISMPLGTFGQLPECAERRATSGVFRSFYYSIDGASLREFSGQQQVQMRACADQDFEVDLSEVFDLSLLEDANFLWEDGWEGPYRRLSQPGDYLIDAQLDCIAIPLNLSILPKNCADNLFVPNAFSPNADGQNDRFQVFLNEEVQIHRYQLSIYDRWGNLLFQTTEPTNFWDGRHGADPVPAGIYFYSLFYEVQELDGTRSIAKNGDVVVVR